jgi:thiamine-monophosphate kinase
VTTVARIGEFGLIGQIRRWTAGQRKSPYLLRGIGDDCALLRTGPRTLLTTDAMVENIHFRRSWSLPRGIGWKALAANVSDIAAGGGTPRAAVISLELPPSLPVDWVRRFYSGLLSCARHFGVAIAGGNLTSSAHVAIHITLLGDAPVRRIGRDGARPGDLVVVTGALGGSRAGLECLQRGWRDADARRAITAHYRVLPSPEAGRILAAHASAMCDISDGLVQDAGHLAEESGAQLVIVPGAVPVHPAALMVAPRLKGDPHALALQSGEEYVLLATVPRSRYGALLRAMRRARRSVAAVGEVRRGRGVHVPGRPGSRSGGFNHFSRGRS